MYNSHQGSYEDVNSSYSNDSYYDQREDEIQPTRIVENFKGANGFVIDGGDFSTVAGNVYHGPDAAMQSPRPRPPNVSSRTSYFENTSNFTIRNGKFMSVGGDVYDSTPTPPSFRGMSPGMALPNHTGFRDYIRPYISLS